jgi:hypothetical protein
MYRRLYTLVLLGSLLSTTADAQKQYVLVNPGVRAGYYFGGPNPGLYLGLDFSVTTWAGESPYAFGAYFSAETRGEFGITHFGLEAFYKSVGISVGPARVRIGNEYDWGVAATAFGGFVALPYYQMVYAAPVNVMHGFGLFVKLPVPLRKLDMSFGGG